MNTTDKSLNVARSIRNKGIRTGSDIVRIKTPITLTNVLAIEVCSALVIRSPEVPQPLELV